MAYTNNVTLLATEGGPSMYADITARVWMLWHVLGTGSGTGNQQSEEGTSIGAVNKGLSAPLQISFPGMTNFANVSRMVGLSIQDTNRVPNDTGWLFRSGAFDDLPVEPIEIITASKTFPSAEVATMLPPMPFTADVGTTTVITAMTTTLAAGGIDFIATGTTHATGVIVAFTYTGRLVLFPSGDVIGATVKAINVGISNPVITFAPGPSVLSAIEAALLNFLRVFVMHEVEPKLRQTLENRVNDAIVAQVGKALTADGSLPAGVILSIRSINSRADPGGTLEVRGALGAFGGVISKLPPIVIPSGGGKTCFIATAVHGAGSPEVQLLRSFRDGMLVNHFAGRKFVSLYEFVSPKLADFISNKPNLKAIARALLVKPGVWLANLSFKIHSKK